MTQTPHYVPASFDKNTLEVVMLPARPVWGSGVRALQRLNTRTAMSFVPIVWQMLPALRAACLACSVPLCLGDASNMPVVAAAVAYGGIDTIIVVAESAFGLTSVLSERNVLPPAWILIHPSTMHWDIPAPLLGSSIRVAQEVHGLPGVVVLEQCDALAASKLPHFHAVEQPLAPMPAVVEVGICSCGAQTYAQL